MKQTLPIALLLLLLAVVSRAQLPALYAQTSKLVETPGALFVGDSLWLDEAEVANIHWLEYLHFLRQDSTETQYQAARPDTTVWNQPGTSNLYGSNYLRHPAFRYYPVVGIMPAQAARYCRWRSAMVNQQLHSAAYLKAHPALRNYTFRVEYRLPTVREWELAAAGGLAPAQYPYGMVLPPAPGSRSYRQQLVRNSAKVTRSLASCQSLAARQGAAPLFQLPFNMLEQYYQGSASQAFRCPALDSLTNRRAGGPCSTTPLKEAAYPYQPNALGFFHMLGNVAELTATSGVAKGGSFRHAVSTTTLQTSIPYTQPQLWLGFRCACTVYIEPRQ